MLRVIEPLGDHRGIGDRFNLDAPPEMRFTQRVADGEPWRQRRP
jgi:hypothetical protein